MTYLIMFYIRILFVVIFQFITWFAAAQSHGQRIMDCKTNIIGIWLSESDADYKIEFTSDGYQKEYLNNVLQTEVALYFIQKSCGLNQDNGFDIFLVRKLQGQSLVCEVINNLYIKNNLYILTLTNERGQLEKYIKQ